MIIFTNNVTIKIDNPLLGIDFESTSSFFAFICPVNDKQDIANTPTKK